MYQKERHEFGRPVNTFAMSEVVILDEFVQEVELKGQHIERNPTILDIQAIPEMSESHVSRGTCAASASARAGSASAHRMPR